MIFGTWNPEKILYQHLTVLSTLNPVYTIQPVVKPVVQAVWQPAVSCKKHPTTCQTGCQTGLTTGLTNTVWQPVECLYTRYSWLSNRLSNAFDNRFDNRLYRVNGAYQSTRTSAERLTTDMQVSLDWQQSQRYIRTSFLESDDLGRVAMLVLS